ncbi:hypothetical protein E4V51_20955, partial [Paenibacillus sp. 28ISP30-2]|nr:hypothetical protein [Paenibacillus sp. 28ISP30-2]
MMQTITGDTGEEWNTIERLRDFLRTAGDGEGAKAVAELLEKAEAEELTIAFCGHFSAGKSSLINSLCGKTVLDRKSGGEGKSGGLGVDRGGRRTYKTY